LQFIIFITFELHR